MQINSNHVNSVGDTTNSKISDSDNCLSSVCCEQLNSLVESINKEALVRNQLCNYDCNVDSECTQQCLLKAGNELEYVREANWSGRRQGIVTASVTECGGVLLEITAKAAGFVLGSHGGSIRAVCAKTGTSSKSWLSNSLRSFLIEGKPENIYQAIKLIYAAVQRYTLLVEGHWDEKKVTAEQIIEGIVFEYKPPPLKLMPKAVRTFRKVLVEGQTPQMSWNGVPWHPIPRVSPLYDVSAPATSYPLYPPPQRQVQSPTLSTPPPQTFLPIMESAKLVNSGYYSTGFVGSPAPPSPASVPVAVPPPAPLPSPRLCTPQINTVPLHIAPHTIQSNTVYPPQPIAMPLQYPNYGQVAVAYPYLV
eukprot:TRINITY_DN1420_c1_g1_i10.p2 TRINITY_DN1420_c1_g1~~TRINITY_DN1420_c1_g1_i10.p2  ORF type:complete len:362 (-),score=18.36 TRINITY_DN1420_c1_g1_i10:4504-5589(-)